MAITKQDIIDMSLPYINGSDLLRKCDSTLLIRAEGDITGIILIETKTSIKDLRGKFATHYDMDLEFAKTYDPSGTDEDTRNEVIVEMVVLKTIERIIASPRVAGVADTHKRAFDINNQNILRVQQGLDSVKGMTKLVVDAVTGATNRSGSAIVKDSYGLIG